MAIKTKKISDESKTEEVKKVVAIGPLGRDDEVDPHLKFEPAGRTRVGG